MRTLFISATLAAVLITAVSSENAKCAVVNPIGNTIVTAGENMKIAWSSSGIHTFPTITLIQSDGKTTPYVIATNVSTSLKEVVVTLPRTLVPSNAYYMTLGTGHSSCLSGNLRILGASMVAPDPKPPGSLNNQISAGRFPKGVNGANSLFSCPNCIVFITIFLCSFILLA